MTQPGDRPTGGGFFKEGNVKVDSLNWHEHTNGHGFLCMGMQPTRTNIHANPHAVVITFADDEAGSGLQIVMTYESFKDYLLSLAKIRETIEAKLEEYGDEEEEP
jgi:hypothetical protein